MVGALYEIYLGSDSNLDEVSLRLVGKHVTLYAITIGDCPS